MTGKTRPPTAAELRDIYTGGERTLEDEQRALRDDLRNGILDDLLTDEDEAKGDEVSQPTGNPAEERSAVRVPDVIMHVLESRDRQELIDLAEMLHRQRSSGRVLTLVFHTPVGDAKCDVGWCSIRAERLEDAKEMLFVKVRSDASNFAPNPGSRLEISFAQYPGRLSVTCLTAPQQLYPGIDLMCFLPDSYAMEKNGKLRKGAPSVVSGRPSDDVDDRGEPIISGENADDEDDETADIRTDVSFDVARV